MAYSAAVIRHDEKVAAAFMGVVLDSDREQPYAHDGIRSH